MSKWLFCLTDQMPMESIVRNKLLELLINLDFPYSFISFMKSFLTERCFYIQVNQSRGELCSIMRGLPQGAILSSMLFNLYVFEFQVSHASFGLYGNDLIIWKSGRDISPSSKSYSTGYKISPEILFSIWLPNISQ